LFYLLAVDDLNAKFHVGLFRYADDMVLDVLPEARYCRCSGAGRRWMSLIATAATRRVNAHAHEHFRIVDDDFLPLVPSVGVTEVLNATQPDALLAVVAAGRDWWFVEKRRK